MIVVFNADCLFDLLVSNVDDGAAATAFAEFPTMTPAFP